MLYNVIFLKKPKGQIVTTNFKFVRERRTAYSYQLEPVPRPEEEEEEEKGPGISHSPMHLLALCSGRVLMLFPEEAQKAKCCNYNFFLRGRQGQSISTMSTLLT